MSTSSNPSTTSADPIAEALKEERQDKYAQAIPQGEKFEPGENLETNSNDLRAMPQSTADAAPQFLASADGNFSPPALIGGPRRDKILKLTARMFRAAIGGERSEDHHRQRENGRGTLRPPHGTVLRKRYVGGVGQF